MESNKAQSQAINQVSISNSMPYETDLYYRTAGTYAHTVPADEFWLLDINAQNTNIVQITTNISGTDRPVGFVVTGGTNIPRRDLFNFDSGEQISILASTGAVCVYRIFKYKKTL